MIKFENTWQGHYQTEEKTIFHLAFSAIGRACQLLTLKRLGEFIFFHSTMSLPYIFIFYHTLSCSNLQGYHGTFGHLCIKAVQNIYHYHCWRKIGFFFYFPVMKHSSKALNSNEHCSNEVLDGVFSQNMHNISRIQTFSVILHSDALFHAFPNDFY